MIKEEDWKARYHDPAVEKRRKKRRRRRRFRRFCTFLVVLALLAGWFLWQQEGLSTETITIESAPDGFSGYRIAVISDLHGKEFGEENERLLNFVAGLEPDLIAMVGDIIHEESQMAMVPAVAEGLAAIAPTYYVTGNHEWAARWASARPWPYAPPWARGSPPGGPLSAAPNCCPRALPSARRWPAPP